MIESVKVNGGFVDQRQFKAASRYGLTHTRLYEHLSSGRLHQVHSTSVKAEVRLPSRYVPRKAVREAVRHDVEARVRRYRQVNPSHFDRLSRREATERLHRKREAIFEDQSTRLPLHTFTTRKNDHAKWRAKRGRVFRS